MPIQPTSPLIAIATDTSISIHDRINIIKGEDKQISSEEEAGAILKISNENMKFTENKSELPLAQMEAKYYLKFGNKNFRTDLVDLYNYCKKKGGEYFAKIVNSTAYKVNKTAKK